MENSGAKTASIDLLIARRLKALRTERGWSLDDLAKRSGVSRATLSRLENAEVSPTTNVLGKLCTVYGLTMSRLMCMVEDDFVPLVRRGMQAVWTDPTVGFRRRLVSPPAQALAAEVIECELAAGTRITYDRAPRPGLEHHLFLIEGELQIGVDGQTYDLQPGDCLRYRLSGASVFVTPEQCGARYMLVMV